MILASKRQDAEHQSPRMRYAVVAAVVLAAAVGIFLRVYHYLFAGSLWLDEAYLALAFVDRDILTLLTQHLPSNQSSPPAFIASVYAAKSIFGLSDMSLRAIPLLAGMATVVLAVTISFREFRTFAGIVAFVALVSLSPVLIYYSGEFKPYASDAMVGLLIVAAISRWESRNRVWIVAPAGLLAVLLSLPSVFVLAPAWILLVVRSRQLSTYRDLIVVTAVWGAGALLHGAYLLAAGTDLEYMRYWWSRFDVFAPFPPKSMGDLYWYMKSIWELTYLSLFEDGVAGPGLRAKDPGQWEWAVTAIIAVAAIESVRLRRPLAIVVVSAVLITVLVSASRAYPFSSRLLVFLVPLVLFVIAQFIDDFARRASRVVTWSLVVGLLLVPLGQAYGYLVKPYPHTDFEKAVDVLNENVGPNDVVAITWWTWRIHQFYRSSLKVDDSRILRVTLNDYDQVLQALKDQNAHRVWIVESHRLAEADTFAEKIASTCHVEGPRADLQSRVYVLDCPWGAE